MRVLAMTVGGTPDPLVTSIQHHRPDVTVLFVTDKPRGGSQALLRADPQGGPGILARAGVGSQAYRVVVVPHPDDLASCYRVIRDALRGARREFPDAEWIADYTGGTKTMSAAMAAAAVRLGWKVSLVQSPRDDLNRAGPAGVPVLQSISPLAIDETVARAKELFERRNYEGAEAVVAEAVRDLALEPEQRDPLVRALNLLRGLAKWDQLAFAEAYDHLKACGEQCRELLPHLAKLSRLAREGASPPYGLVWDLLANAEGRAAQGRYEDAILRLYRAVELLAQVRLLEEHGLDTGDLDLAKIPDPLRTRIEARCRGRGKPTAGLVDAYQILAALGDTLGELYEREWDKRVLELLSLRNKAFMEHGFQPLGEDEWKRAHQIAHEFLAEAAERLKLRMVVPSPPRWEAVEALLST